MEIVGVVLGALPIALQGFQTLNRFYLHCEDYDRQLIRANLSVIVQDLKFRDSIRLLFRNLISEEILTQCLNSSDQRAWREFSEVELALAALSARNTEAEGLQAAILEMRQLFEELLPYLKTPTVDPDSKQQVSWRKSRLRVRRKLGWYISNQTRVEQLLGHIGKVNDDITVLVRALRQCTRQATADPVVLSLPQAVEDTRKTYIGLFGAFSENWEHCGCKNHSMSLALLVKCPHFQSGIDDIAPCLPIETVIVKEKHGWHLDINKEGQVTAERVSNSLCCDLFQGSHDPVNPKCVKLLSEENSLGFQVTLSNCPGHPRSLWKSLSAIFENVEVPVDLKQYLQETRCCLELAYSLSLNLLRLYSTSWLTSERVWSTQEVVFFPNHDKNPFYSWRNATPYLFPSSKVHSGRALSQVRGITHPHVFALGVLLLELALGKGMEANLSGDAFYHAVISLAHSDEVERRMGRQYAETVRRCLYFQFDNATGYDFTSLAVQQAFMKNIVGPLGQYAASFQGDPPVIAAG